MKMFGAHRAQSGGSSVLVKRGSGRQSRLDPPLTHFSQIPFSFTPTFQLRFRPLLVEMRRWPMRVSGDLKDNSFYIGLS